jgi:hypothetical protein
MEKREREREKRETSSRKTTGCSNVGNSMRRKSRSLLARSFSICCAA